MDNDEVLRAPLGMTDEEAAARFDELQGQLVKQWKLIRSMNQLEQTMVVVPSREPVAAAAAGTEAATGAGLLAAAEEQLLVLLLLLRKPRARIIYCSSQAIQPSIIDYYLGLLPGVIPSHARARLLTVPLHDATARPLTRKMLDRPRVIERLSHLISDTATTHIVPATPSRLERNLALWLGIPVFGADPSFLRYCETETSHQLCDQLGIMHVAAGPQEVQHDELRRASVQLRINPLAQVELQSSHDHGPVDAVDSGPSYCRFPADSAYAATIAAEAVKIGQHLAGEGLLGRLEVGFQVARAGDQWQPAVTGLDLQKGATTVPFLTLGFLTNGSYDAERSVFTTAHGQPRSYLAAEQVQDPCYRGITADDIFDIVVRHGLHFDHTTQTGVVLHSLSALSECGCFGLTAIAESPRAATELFDRTIATIGFEAERTVAESILPTRSP